MKICPRHITINIKFLYPIKSFLKSQLPFFIPSKNPARLGRFDAQRHNTTLGSSRDGDANDAMAQSNQILPTKNNWKSSECHNLGGLDFLSFWKLLYSCSCFVGLPVGYTLMCILSGPVLVFCNVRM